MIWWVILIEALIFALFFTGIVFIGATKGKYNASTIHNYPPDIQEEYFKTHDKVDVSSKSIKVIITKSCGILMFIAIFTLCSYLAGAKTFLEGFLLGLGLMLWLGLPLE